MISLHRRETMAIVNILVIVIMGREQANRTCAINTTTTTRINAYTDFTSLVNVCAFNCYVLNSNICYVQELIENNQVTFTCEHWLTGTPL